MNSTSTVRYFQSTPISIRVVVLHEDCCCVNNEKRSKALKAAESPWEDPSTPKGTKSSAAVETMRRHHQRRRQFSSDSDIDFGGDEDDDDEEEDEDDDEVEEGSAAARRRRRRIKMKCLSCKEDYGDCDAGTCRECYEEAGETEEELKREIDELKSKVNFLRLLSIGPGPVGPNFVSRPNTPCFSDVVLVASGSSESDDSQCSSPSIPAHRAVLVLLHLLIIYRFSILNHSCKSICLCDLVRGGLITRAIYELIGPVEFWIKSVLGIW